jgi:hypothetical protein
MAVAGWTRPDMLLRYTRAQASARAAAEARALRLGDSDGGGQRSSTENPTTCSASVQRSVLDVLSQDEHATDYRVAPVPAGAAPSQVSTELATSPSPEARCFGLRRRAQCAARRCRRGVAVTRKEWWHVRPIHHDAGPP